MMPAGGPDPVPVPPAAPQGGGAPEGGGAAEDGTLVIEQLVSGHGDLVVLGGVSLRVPPGSVLACLGRNGVGKTTLVETVAGIVPTIAGTVRLGGTRLTGLPPHRIARAGVALVPQGRRIYPSLSVGEHLRLSASIRSRQRSREPRWSIERVLETFPRLAERLQLRAGDLSGGEQQMLALVRALLLEPSVLLLDEPSEGLAPRVVESIGAVVGTLAADGISVLLVEQNLRLALSVADRVVVMVRGEIAYEGEPSALASSPERIRELLGVG